MKYQNKTFTVGGYSKGYSENYDANFAPRCPRCSVILEEGLSHDADGNPVRFCLHCLADLPANSAK